MPRSPEELTELECVIDLYCREAAAHGFVFGDTCATCVLAAVAFAQGLGPKWGDATIGELDRNERITIARGYDRNPSHGDWDPQLLALGERFADRVHAGEYRHVG